MLRKGDIKTLEDLKRAIEECYTPGPSVEWMDGVLNIQDHFGPHLPASHQVEGITKHQFYTISADPNAPGPVKAVVKSRCFSDSPDSSEPCHLLLDIPTGKPQYVACRPIFPSKAKDGSVLEPQEQFLKCKRQIYDIIGRHKWGDDVASAWEKDFKYLDDLQQRPSIPFDGFWPSQDVSNRIKSLWSEFASFFDLSDNDVEPIEEDATSMNSAILEAELAERCQRLANLEEKLQVGSFLRLNEQICLFNEAPVPSTGASRHAKQIRRSFSSRMLH